MEEKKEKNWGGAMPVEEFIQAFRCTPAMVVTLRRLKAEGKLP